MRIKYNVAIVGAGLGGALVSRRLADAGLKVTLFDKDRSSGGRLKHAIIDGAAIDIGVPQFPGNSERLNELRNQWIDAGVIQPWPVDLYDFHADGQPYLREQTLLYSGVPTQSRVTEQLLDGIDLLTGIRVVTAIAEDGWYLRCDQGETHGPYDFLVMALPGPKAAQLLKEFPGLRAMVKNVEYIPCWASIIEFEQPLDPGFEVAHATDRFNGFPGQNPLYMLVHHNSKPGRYAGKDTWVVYWCARESIEYKDVSADEVSERSLRSLEKLLDRPLPEAKVRNHHWLYCQAFDNLNENSFFIDKDIHMGLCGDWFEPGGIAGTVASAEGLAQAVLDSLAERKVELINRSVKSD